MIKKVLLTSNAGYGILALQTGDNLNTQGKIMTSNEYIEHEVQIRVHDLRFNNLEKEIHKISGQVTGLYGLIIGQYALFIGAIVTPIALHHFHLT